MARRTTDFQTIRAEGGLLRPDLLRRMLDPKVKLEGTRIEIISPCHLPDNLTVDNIRAGNSNIRNPILVS